MDYNCFAQSSLKSHPLWITLSGELIEIATKNSLKKSTLNNPHFINFELVDKKDQLMNDINKI